MNPTHKSEGGPKNNPIPLSSPSQEFTIDRLKELVPDIHFEKLPEALKTPGMPLVFKFTLLITLIIFISSGFFLLLSWQRISQEMENLLTDSGKILTHLAATIPIDTWRSMKDPTHFFNQPLVGEIETLRNFIQATPRPSDPNFQNFYNETTRYLNQWETTKENLSREARYVEDPLVRLLHSEPKLLNMFITDKNGILIVGSPVEPFRRQNLQRLNTQEGTLFIDRAVYQAPDNAWVSVRYFVQEIRDSQGTLQGFVHLVISADVLEEAQKKLFFRFLLPLAITLVLAITLGIYLSRTVTRPLQQLLADIRIVSEGTLSHRTLPKSNDEFSVIASSFNLMTRNLRKALEGIYRTFVIRQEYMAATKLISDYLLKIKNKPPLPNLNLAIIYQPSKDVSGDYFDYFQLDTHHLGVAVADVAGKGLPAAVINTIFKNLMRHETFSNPSVTDTLIKVNRTLTSTLRGGMFITCLYFILDLQTYEVQIASAGHLPLLLLKAQSQEIMSINPQGVALGLDPKLFNKTLASQTVSLEPGDRLIAYTDGVTEAMNPQNELYGLERLKNLLKKYPHKNSDELVTLIREDINVFTDNSIAEDRLSDDMTLVAIRRTQ